MPIVINIAGSMTRSGTTTQCLQLCRFLLETGYRAAYFECNRQNYLSAVQVTYSDVSFRSTPDHLCFSGIDLYAGSRFGEFLEDDRYDYLICDFGNTALRSFQREQFLSGDARILTGGVKPGEMEELTRVMADRELADSIFILSFVPAGDEAMIRELLEERSGMTVFSPYLPDPFGNYSHAYREGGCFYALMDLVLYMAEQRNDGNEKQI